MKKKKLVGFGCLATLVLLLLFIAVGYVKSEYDFPANTKGYADLERATGIKRTNGEVFIRYTGWTDTQTYLKFQATQEEIDRVIEKLKLVPRGGVPDWSEFYWWDPQPCTDCQYYGYSEGGFWIWLHYNSKTETTYYYHSTT